MKQLNYVLSLLFVMAVTHAKADIIIKDFVKLSAEISNLSDFPDLVIVGTTYSLTSKRYLEIENNTLEIGFLPNRLGNFYVVKKAYLDKTGFENIDWETDKNVQKLNVETWKEDAESDTYSAIHVEFKLVKKKDIYYMYPSKITSKPKVKSNQQVADVVKTLKDDVADPLKPIRVSAKTILNL